MYLYRHHHRVAASSAAPNSATLYDLYIRTDVLWREVQWNVSSGTCGPVLPYFWLLHHCCCCGNGRTNWLQPYILLLYTLHFHPFLTFVCCLYYTHSANTPSADSPSTILQVPPKSISAITHCHRSCSVPYVMRIYTYDVYAYVLWMCTVMCTSYLW